MPERVTRLIVEVDKDQTLLAENPAGLVLQVQRGQRGVALRHDPATETAEVQVAHHGKQTIVMIPWANLRVIGKTDVTQY